MWMYLYPYNFVAHTSNIIANFGKILNKIEKVKTTIHDV